MLAAKLWVTHSLGVGFKVVGLGANLFGQCGMSGIQATKRGHELFNFPLVEQPLLVESGGRKAWISGSEEYASPHSLIGC